MRTSIFKDFPTGYPNPDLVLGYGELFIELPPNDSDNIRVKYGDGETKYKDLPYRLGDTSTDELYFSESEVETLSEALEKVVSGADVKTIISNLKKAIELTASGSGQIIDIGKEKVQPDLETKKYDTVEEALAALTEKESLSIVLGTLTQAIKITYEQGGTGIDIAVEKLSKVVEDEYKDASEALANVTAGKELGVVIGALKNAIELVEQEIPGPGPTPPSPTDVGNSVITYDESKAETVKEALDEAGSGNKLKNIISGLKAAIKLVQIGGGENINVTKSEIEYVPSYAETKEDALDEVDQTDELGILVGALKRAIELTDDTSDYGEETAILGARKLNASLRSIMDDIDKSGVYQGSEETLQENQIHISTNEGKKVDNAIPDLVDISYKDIIFKESNASTEKAALNTVESGNSLGTIIAGLKKAIELIDHEIDISNMTIEYIDDNSTSVAAVETNAKSGKQLKSIVASLKRSIELLNDKVDNTVKTVDDKNKQLLSNVGSGRVSFTNADSSTSDPTKLMAKIVTGTELSVIVADLKRGIELLDKKIPQPVNINKEGLILKDVKGTSATTVGNSVKTGIAIADAVSALKQAILLLDKNKMPANADISAKPVAFKPNKASTRSLALQSVLSGNSLSANIAALKRAIELTEQTDDISNKTVKFVENTSITAQEALANIKSGAALNTDIAGLKRAVELISGDQLHDLDISTKKIVWNLATTGTTLDVLANIKSGQELNILMPYIKRALKDSYDKISELERTQKQLKKTIEEISVKLNMITK